MEDLPLNDGGACSGGGMILTHEIPLQHWYHWTLRWTFG